MIQISNTDFERLVKKLPVLFRLVADTELTLSEQNDVRQFKLLHKRFTRTYNNINKNQHDTK